MLGILAMALVPRHTPSKLGIRDGSGCWPAGIPRESVIEPHPTSKATESRFFATFWTYWSNLTGDRMKVELCLVVLLLYSQAALTSVVLDGGEYCRTDIGDGTHARPGTNITINCVVDTFGSNISTNLLIWTIPSEGVSITHFNGELGSDPDDPEFVSTINSFNNTLLTTNATLTFQATSDLDQAVVNCEDVLAMNSNCTLFILTVPSAPELSSHNCMNIMSSSLILQWNPPSDDGGKSIHYNVIGTPDDISFITDNTMMAIPNLTPNTEYKFVVRAINSVGFGDELYIQCTTLGNVPNGFSNIQVSLDYMFSSDSTLLYVGFLPCPIVADPITTPPIDNYTVNIIKSGNTYSTEDIDTSICYYTKEVNEDDTYNVEVFANNIIGNSNRRKVDFVASWLRDDDVTEMTNTTVVIEYTTAERVLLDDLMVELNINIPSINPSRVSYVTNTTGMFSLTDLPPNAVLTYNLQVVFEDMSSFITIGMTRTSSSFTVSSSSSSSSVPLPSTTTTVTTSSSDSTTMLTISTTRTPSQAVTPTSDDAGHIDVFTSTFSLTFYFYMYICVYKQQQ